MNQSEYIELQKFILANKKNESALRPLLQRFRSMLGIQEQMIAQYVDTVGSKLDMDRNDRYKMFYLRCYEQYESTKKLLTLTEFYINDAKSN